MGLEILEPQTDDLIGVLRGCFAQFDAIPLRRRPNQDDFGAGRPPTGLGAAINGDLTIQVAQGGIGSTRIVQELDAPDVQGAIVAWIGGRDIELDKHRLCRTARLDDCPPQRAGRVGDAGIAVTVIDIGAAVDCDDGGVGRSRRGETRLGAESAQHQCGQHERGQQKAFGCVEFFHG